MNTQRRRLETTSDSDAVLNSNSQNRLQLDINEGIATNVHGLRYCFSIEPENADANANGWWVVFCLPAGLVSANTDLPSTIGTLGDDTELSPYMWGLGCWTASNQAPYHGEFNPSTSRNCQRNARIVLYIVKEGISAGNVRIIQTMTCFTN